jgi:hypothetical protein
MLTRSKPMGRGNGFKAKAKATERAARPDRSAEFASWQPKARPVAEAVMAAGLAARPPAAASLKVAEASDQRIRDSARGEECTVRIVGACTYDPTHTIWSHAPLGAAGKGKSIKAIDLAGAYCCTACDAVIDGQRPLPPGATRESVMLDWFMGHMRSLVLLKRKGLA